VPSGNGIEIWYQILILVQLGISMLSSSAACEAEGSSS
jgi:hypothetical protein